MRSAAMLAVAAFALAGCGSSDDSEPRRTTPAAKLPRGVAAPVTLSKTYPFQGGTRKVTTSVVPGSVLDPWRDPAVPVPPGRRLVAAQMTWLDQGPDPFPRKWARYDASDDRGEPALGAFVGPARRSGRLTVQPVGFLVSEGRRLAEVEMSSIVDVWRFEAEWRLRGA